MLREEIQRHPAQGEGHPLGAAEALHNAVKDYEHELKVIHDYLDKVLNADNFEPDTVMLDATQSSSSEFIQSFGQFAANLSVGNIVENTKDDVAKALEHASAARTAMNHVERQVREQNYTNVDERLERLQKALRAVGRS